MQMAVKQKTSLNIRDVLLCDIFISSLLERKKTSCTGKIQNLTIEICDVHHTWKIGKMKDSQIFGNLQYCYKVKVL